MKGESCVPETGSTASTRRGCLVEGGEGCPFLSRRKCAIKATQDSINWGKNTSLCCCHPELGSGSKADIDAEINSA